MSNEVTPTAAASPAAVILGSGALRAIGSPPDAVQPVQPVPASGGNANVLQKAAEQVVQAMPGNNRFDMSFDKQAGMTVVRVFNRDSGELVRQIPTEEVVRLAQLMRQEEARSAVLDVTA